MIRSNPQGDYPTIHKTAYIDPSAVVLGNVMIGKNVFVAPGAVIRADEWGSSITIGDHCNIQDRVIIHALGDSSVIIGKKTSLSHGCIVHGPCRIGKECFIGFGSVIFRAKLHDGVFVKFMATVLEVVIPSRRVIANGLIVDKVREVKVLGSVSKEEREFSRKVLKANLDLLKGYRSLTNG